MVYSAQFDPHVDQVTEAHGIMGSLAWVIFFPLGATLMRLVPGPKAWLVHAGFMLFALCIFTANVGMGIWIAEYYNLTHTIIGLVVFSLAWTQPIGGLLHHWLYKKYSRRTIVSFIHMGLGRALITLGMVNGGLGLLLSDDASRSEYIAYGTVAGIVWMTYFLVAFYHDAEREKSRDLALSNGKVFDDQTSSQQG